MAARQPAKSSAEGTNVAQPTSFRDRPFNVEAIRFDPDTLSLGSQSSLSSSMTPEAITLTFKRAAGPRNDFSFKINMGSTTVPPASPAENTSRTADSTHGSGQAITGLNLSTSPVIDASRSSTATTAPYQASREGKKPIGKLTTQYVMPDGSVITGKGLGRGRPGVKRGPRKLKTPGEDSAESTPVRETQLSTPSASATGGKRKRSGSDTSDVRVRSVSSSLQSRESSVEYNPTATHTRSGRQTQKPVTIVAQVVTPSATASPASKKVTTPSIPTPAFKTHPKIKRKVYRGKEQFALCEHCLRGSGPAGNVIVFCDACNKCWHQRCHQPQISKDLVADTKAEWFCATCDKILHGNKKSKKAAPPKPEASVPGPPPEQRFGLPFVGAIALTLEQRQKYLESLSREKLIAMLLRAGELAPQMPIFETPIPLPRMGPYLQPQFTSDYVTPVSEIPVKADNERDKEKAGLQNDLPDEGYDDSYDEHAALYPLVGEGVRLPLEREDLNMLLEGPESRTFSHWVKGMPVKTLVDTVPLHLSWADYTKRYSPFVLKRDSERM